MSIENMFGDLDKIDILAEKPETKEVLMVLVCNGFIDGSPETQKALLDKMEGYLNHTQSEEFQKEYGGWSVILRVTLGREPDERILALLSKCPAWAEDYGVNLEFEIGGKPVRIVRELTALNPNQKEEPDMPTTEWMNRYEAIKDKLACKTDLEAYFTEKAIGTMGVDVLDIGAVHFPTGTIFACDPMVELEDTLPFIQTIPAGTYPVKICVVPSKKYGDRYACVKVEVSGEKPVRYELAMTGKEDLNEELKEGDYFGFGVDAGMGCVADIQTQAAFKSYWAKQTEEDPDIDPYNDLFCDLLEENAKAHPKYQSSYGDWLNWIVPDTDCNLPIFASGWGDGYYPVYFGYDAKGTICAVYLQFIDIEASYKEQA